MKKLITLVGAAALALLTTSCLQQHTTLSLNKDGSGTITETTALGAQMLAMMGAAGGEGQDPLAEMIEQAKARSAEAAKTMGEGVTVKEVKALNEGGKKGFVVVYAFTDINKLKYSFGQGMGDNPEEDNNDPIQMSYKDGVLTVLNDYDQEEGDAAADEDEEEIDDASMAMAKQMMADMRVSFSLEFPGGIAETNAEHVDGGKVTLIDIDMGKLVQNEAKFKEFTKKQPGSPAEAKEMLKGVDGVKIETAEKVTIKLK